MKCLHDKQRTGATRKLDQAAVDRLRPESQSILNAQHGCALSFLVLR